MNTKEPYVENLVGRRFNRLVVIEYSHIDKHRQHCWVCRCDCENLKITRQKSLFCGDSQSCGCLKIERVSSHGMYKSKTHKTWRAMLYRCQHDIKGYGGRGIKVCDRWKIFKNFLEDMGERPEGKTIDRIDPNGNYEPGNCRWATWREQATNKNNSVIVTIDGITKPLIEWAEEKGMNYTLVLGRYSKGWPIDQIFRPSQKGRSKDSPRMKNVAPAMSNDLKQERRERAIKQWADRKAQGQNKL